MTIVLLVVLALLGLDKMRWNIWTMLAGQPQLYDAAREALGGRAVDRVAPLRAVDGDRGDVVADVVQHGGQLQGHFHAPLGRNCSVSRFFTTLNIALRGRASTKSRLPPSRSAIIDVGFV